MASVQNSVCGIASLPGKAAHVFAKTSFKTSITMSQRTPSHWRAMDWSVASIAVRAAGLR